MSVPIVSPVAVSSDAVRASRIAAAVPPLLA
jgi:hypothetical protein